MPKLLLGSLVLVLCALGWGSSGFGQAVPAPQGELRSLDNNPGNWVSLTCTVFGHLIELDTERVADAMLEARYGITSVAYTQGTRFQPGWRESLDPMLHGETW